MNTPAPHAATGTWHKLRWPLVALAALLLFNLALSPSFFQLHVRDGRLYGSIVDVFNRASPVMLLALGMTLVIATGGVDLSVGAVMAIAGAVAAGLVRSGQPLVVSVGVAVATGLAAGLWNGVLVGYVRVPPIVATLILMVSGRGVAQLLTGGQILTFENKPLEYLGNGAFLGLPFPITLVALVFLVMLALTQRTATGLFLEATGDNESASHYAGVNIRGVRLLAYGSCGVCAALAGLIVAANIKAADANNAGLYLELDAILAVVVGGTALAGGRIFLGGSLVGALLIQTLATTIITRNIPPTFTLMVKAAVIIAVCLLQSPKLWKKRG
jgi:simple sugar transport system permease protein